MQLDVEDGIIAARFKVQTFAFVCLNPNGISTPLSRAHVSSCTDRGITWKLELLMYRSFSKFVFKICDVFVYLTYI